MANRKFRITGRVVDRKTNQGIPGLHLEAWDQDLIIDDYLGEANTDAEGRFVIEFDENQFRDLLEHYPDVFFKLTHDVTIQLDLPATEEPKAFVVKGTVRQADGTPLVNILVRAFDKDLRHEELLGETHTDAQGRYEFFYTSAQFVHFEKNAADLIVRISDAKGKEIFSSPVIFKARHQETVNHLLGGISQELVHAFYARSKPRTERIQCQLERLGYPLDPIEVKKRIFDTSTENALKQYQEKVGLSPDGRLTEYVADRLRDEEIKVRFTTKTQIGQMQRTLLRAVRIAKLDIKIEPDELKMKYFGVSTRAAITAFQNKYRLEATGELDLATYDRMVSVAASRTTPVKKLKVKAVERLTPIKRVQRLNMTNKHVAEVQQALAFLGHKIDEKEFNTKTFGKTTREAVVNIQRTGGLPVTGHIEGSIVEYLNRIIQQVNPRSAKLEYPYRVRGSVRDELWQGKGGVKVQVWEKIVRGVGTQLAERKSLANGFYDVPYDPPRNPVNGQIKSPFHLEIKVLGAKNQELDSKMLFNPTQIAWVNFTQGDQPYRGTSEYETRMKAIKKILDDTPIADIEKAEIIHVAINSGLTPDDVIRLVLAHRVAAQLDHAQLGPEACYAFFAQGLPPNLPGDLYENIKGWSLDKLLALVDQIANGLVFMERDPQALALEKAMTSNLMPISIGRKKDEILAAFAELRLTYALVKPTLLGNSSLQDLLSASMIKEQQLQNAVAAVFLEQKNLGTSFWEALNKEPGEFGGTDAIKDFRATVEIGQITKNFMPMVNLLKRKIQDNENGLNSARDLAKLTHESWKTLINDSGVQVPPDTDIDSYAATLASQSEQLYPAVALAATVGRSERHPLSNIEAIQRVLDENPNLNLRAMNLDDFAQKTNLDAVTLTELRVMQRVHRIVPTAIVGLALLEEGIHNSAQIVALGKDRFASMLIKQNIEPRTALTVFGLAEYQYAQVLQRITDYRFELHRADPRAIIDHTYTAEELAGLPNLETLFGSLDYCECPHCQSVYGPPAYLADVLRYLDSHNSEVEELDKPNKPYQTVKDILFVRRPDIGIIKLNCVNAETPLPYIDLVCEVLENAYVDLVCEVRKNDYVKQVCEELKKASAKPGKNPDFSYQTTRTAAELRAFPEHVRPEAYVLLKKADYPMNIAFDLWQEEARVFLQHLGVPRWELMEAFQYKASPSNEASPDDLPKDDSIAGEYFGMSSHETEIIISKKNTEAEQKIYWGFDNISQEITVADFMRRSHLDYEQLLDLLHVQWINPFCNSDKIRIERPLNSCSTKEQKLVSLTCDRLDQMHRFLRLWRRTGWAMWELDLLIRATAIGNNQLNSETLVRLKQFKLVQQRLGLPTDRALSLYDPINTEVRIKPDEPQREIKPLYAHLFLNPAVIQPVDEKFALYSDDEAHLYVRFTELLVARNIPPEQPLMSDHIATLLAAFSLKESELALLFEADLILQPDGKKTKIEDKLTVANLTLIGRHVNLAKGLGLKVKDLLTFLSLSEITDVFASPEATLDFIESYGWIAKSGFLIDELDYLLSYRSDAPYGLRNQVISQYIESLREDLRTCDAEVPEDQIKQKQARIISHVATAFSVPSEQAQLLLAQMELGEESLITQLQNSLGEDKPNDITEDNFQIVYNVYRLLHKAVMLLNRLKISTPDLEWLLKNFAKFGLLNFSALLVTDATVLMPSPATGFPIPLFPSWLSLYKWLYIKRLYPEPEDVSLTVLFDKAAIADSEASDLHDAICKLTPWQREDIDALATAWKLQHDVTNKNDYANIDTYIRLWTCYKQINRIGVGAKVLLVWVKRDDDANHEQSKVAQQIRQAAKSKYNDKVWLDKVTPLEDVLRQKKRDALVGNLIEISLRFTTQKIKFKNNEYSNPAYWQDANDLLSYFLIDVEMSACQLTSRIKQAMSTTQMFVQRCLLGLERPWIEISRKEQQETVSENSWNQWKWMKNYRLWEANRKVFLYPENWIEPELRDDKSPFFKELEAELSQNEITDENAEAALLHYVQKVHEVARLTIVGVYYELDDTDPRDNLPPDINRLHVVGRTHSDPFIYYYRQFDLNYGEWTAWEKIDLDIQSDHAIPVVYNRRVYLFWLNFLAKPQKVRKQPPAMASDKPTDAPEPPNQLEIQLAWSQRKDVGWTAKKVSHQKLIHPWQRPLFSYNLKSRYKSREENLLWLDIYISQSQEFNNTRFWDAYRNVQDFVTSFRYHETMRPWHSSSFVFDGEVVDVKMRGLAGHYHMLDNNGLSSDDLTPTNSHSYVHDNFGQDGRTISRLSTTTDEIAPRLSLPEGMHYHNTRLANNKSQLNANRVNVLEHHATRTLLSGAKSPFEIVFSQHRINFDTAGCDADTGKRNQGPFFYQDKCRAFFIKPEWQEVLAGHNETLLANTYNFYPFYHPYTSLFMRELNRSGLDGLLNRRIQITLESFYPFNDYDFSSYSPGAMSVPDKNTAQKDIVDFERYGAYSIYNWEIFFHVPLLIACKLSANQRFAEAMRWFHYIFDPTNTDRPEVPQRYWVTRQFFEQNSKDYREQRIKVLLENIETHEDELKAWKNNPFKPHLIARCRPVAYQKAVVMKYIDNLIAWGDQLFRRDTIEAINEATTLYVLAYELLGRRPVKVPNVEHNDQSYNELTTNDPLDPFGNKKLQVLMENYTLAPAGVVRTQVGKEPPPQFFFYFGIPNNDQLLDYWNRVEDRLFKIRHCMNIQGVVRQLPLFEPPIDPALLVKAAAAGVDLSSVLVDTSLQLSPYRFRTMVQQALALCGEVRALGDKLLSALEKQDAESLSLLRSTKEIELQQAVREVREQQIKEAEETLASLDKSKELATEKKGYYESRDFMNGWEIAAFSAGGLSWLTETSIAVGYTLAGGLALIPTIKAGFAGFGGTPKGATEVLSGEKLARAAEAGVKTLQSYASSLNKSEALLTTIGNYWRRQDDWDFQGRLATKEIAQIEKQSAAAKIRLAIAQQELTNHELNIEHLQAVDDYMRSKYTNVQLYDWMVRQLASVYFQSYQLAYDMAKRAEKCLQFELGAPDATFVQFGWDSLKTGLLSGERLVNDIHRMESTYLEQNTRDIEITKHVSLAQFFPLRLLALKEGVACTVTLPEWLFDMDYPGHYRRRLKSVSISIPCVVGPYTSVNCTLTLKKQGIRMNESLEGGYGDPLDDSNEDSRFDRSRPEKHRDSIATSHGQNDSGMFEPNFNDERFLPFEGWGAVSEWEIKMPEENNQFDMATISDVIMHIRYTAKPSESLIDPAKKNLNDVLPKEGARLLVLNREFSSAWHHFLNTTGDPGQALSFKLGLEHLPFYARTKKESFLTKVDLIVESPKIDGFDAEFEVNLKVAGTQVFNKASMTPNEVFGGQQYLCKSDFPSDAPLLGEWQIQIRIKKTADGDFKSLKPEDVQNTYLVLGFKTS